MKKLIPFIAILGLALVCLGSPLGIVLWVVAALSCAPRLQPYLNAFPADNCSGRLIDVSRSTGCSLSTATVKAWTTTDLEAAALKEIGYDNEFSRLREARIAGYRESTLNELVMSRVTNMKSLVQRRNVKGNPSMVFPFIQMVQKRNINVQYWKITSGTPTPGAGSNGLHSGAWNLVVANQDGAFATALPNIHNFFLPGRTLFVDYLSSANVARHLMYKIIAASTSSGVTTVTVEPNYTNEGWAALTAPEKLVYQIGGLAGGNAEAGTGCYIGANSVSDYESYKEQDSSLNNSSILNFPLQTSRIVWQYTDQYLKLLNNALMGNFFKTFWQLPEAEQRRQHQKFYEDQIMQSVFFGQRINEKQTPATYDSLPTVYDPANDNCPLEYKTNALGIQTQLTSCGRYLDLGGAALDLDDFFNRLYLIKRARQADSNDVSDIDIMCDRGTAGLIQQIMCSFYQKYYKQVDTNYHRAGEVIDTELNRKITVFNYRQYDIPDEFGGFRLNVFTHNFFNDKLAAFGGNSVHRMMWVIDWSDFYMGVVATNQRTTQTNPDDELYRYRIKINSKHVQLNSMTWTAILEDPNRHLIVRNFAATCPKLTVQGCDVAPAAP